MDDWTKRLLEQQSQYRAAAAAFREIERYGQFNQHPFPAGRDFAAALAVEEKRIALRNAGWVSMFTQPDGF